MINLLSQFILLHWNSCGSFMSPVYCLLVFLSFCRSVLVHLSSPEFTFVHLNSYQFVSPDTQCQISERAQSGLLHKDAAELAKKRKLNWNGILQWKAISSKSDPSYQRYQEVLIFTIFQFLKFLPKSICILYFVFVFVKLWMGCSEGYIG